MQLNNLTFLNRFTISWTFFILLMAGSCESEPPKNIEGAEVIVAERFDSLIWYWDSPFSLEEKAKLTDWIEQVFKATEKTLGDYPFDVHIHFERADNSKNPVPFGLASRRGGINQVRLYVNPAASLDELLEDWTAPHELSHLSIPFLGKKNKWFLEGFATYLSRKTLITMGVMTDIEYERMYLDKIKATKKYFNSSTKTFVEVADSLVSHHSYSSFYWGGSSFFMTLDKKLEHLDKMPFIDVLKEYQHCCRLSDNSLLDVIESFDKIIGESIVSELMENYRIKPSFHVMQSY
ncbi:hypothetical protein N8987_07220 [Crocinitomix sp.]|nr:hypothetical protein [Crocinitomix sp.]